jgi:AP-1-like transcription factor
MTQPDPRYTLSPNQQDLLLATLSSNRSSTQNRTSSQISTSKPSDRQQGNRGSITQNGLSTNDYFNSAKQMTASPDQFLNNDDSPYLGFDLDADGDDQFDFDSNGQLIGDYPGDTSPVDSSDLHEKRKSLDDKDEDDEGGGKRRESEAGTSKKPGRKPLTAEPTTVGWVCPDVPTSTDHW